MLWRLRAARLPGDTEISAMFLRTIRNGYDSRFYVGIGIGTIYVPNLEIRIQFGLPDNLTKGIRL